ncbi:hypothetical protein SCYAM73S_00328 [Streptomyces cyaneofuscatus]
MALAPMGFAGRGRGTLDRFSMVSPAKTSPSRVLETAASVMPYALSTRFVHSWGLAWVWASAKSCWMVSLVTGAPVGCDPTFWPTRLMSVEMANRGSKSPFTPPYRFLYSESTRCWPSSAPLPKVTPGSRSS